MLRAPFGDVSFMIIKNNIQTSETSIGNRNPVGTLFNETETNHQLTGSLY